MNTLESLRQAIIDGKAPLAKNLAETALREGAGPDTLFTCAVVPAMDEVSRRMTDCEYFMPEVLLSARAAKAVAELMRPLLVGDQAFRPAGTVLIGTVRGDMHDIGKNMVSMLLESAGFHIVDLGVNVQAEKFVDAVRTSQVDIVAMSSLLTTTMLNMKEVIEALQAADLRGGVKIMVGGAPVTEEWARSIGADGYGSDAPAAVTLARQWARTAADVQSG